MFKVSQKAEHEHASLFCDTEKRLSDTQNAENVIRMNDVWKDSEWHDQS